MNLDAMGIDWMKLSQFEAVINRQAEEIEASLAANRSERRVLKLKDVENFFEGIEVTPQNVTIRSYPRKRIQELDESDVRLKEELLKLQTIQAELDKVLHQPDSK